MVGAPRRLADGAAFVSFTKREIALLRIADAVEDQETPEERQARYSRESNPYFVLVER